MLAVFFLILFVSTTARAVPYGANLIVNGNAEAGGNSSTGAPVSVPGWTTTSAFTVMPYGAPGGFPDGTDSGPFDRAAQFFAGGSAASSSASQDIDLSANVGDINAGIVRFNLSGWLGGYLDTADNAKVTVTFFDGANNVVGETVIGPVFPGGRGNSTGLFFRQSEGLLPAGATRIHIDLTMTRVTGTFDDGYADSLSLVLTTYAKTANVLTVTNLNDSGAGSLRAAIAAAAAGDTIQFAGGLTGTLTLTSGEFVIDRDLTISGPGAKLLTISGGATARIFHVTNGVVHLTGLTIANGSSLGAVGDMDLDTPGGDGFGGGILNEAGTLISLLDCALNNNAAVGGEGYSAPNAGSNGGYAFGGAIFASGAVELTRCTFENNGASGGRGGEATANVPGDISGTGGYSFGGAIFGATHSTVTLKNCTLNSNLSAAGEGGPAFDGADGGWAYGGAVYGGGSISVLNSTLSGNESLGGNGADRTNGGPGGNGFGGALFAAVSGNASLRNTILGDNVVFGGLSGDPLNPGADGLGYGQDVFGHVTSEGHNLVGFTEDSDGWTSDDLTDLSPQLGTLRDNGGPTRTVALLSGSPALDAGSSSGLSTDQRARSRLVDNPDVANANGGDGSDIGAVEMDLLEGPDGDSDGMADDFEAFYGVTAPNLDADSDGITNVLEFEAGTNPINATSALKVSSIARGGSDLVIHFTAVGGKTYGLRRKLSLTDPSWQSIFGVADFTASASGPAAFTDPGAASLPSAFYRIEIGP